MSDISKKWTIEVIWWLVTAVITILVILPILNAGIDYPWLWYNVAYIVGAVTMVRYIFTLHHHPLARSKVFKTAMILLIPLIFFPTLEGIHDFLEYCDQEGLQTIMPHLEQSQQQWYMSYIRTEYVLFAVTCFIGVFAMIIKNIRSLWRQSKYDTI